MPCKFPPLHQQTLQHVNVQFARGERVAVLGNNGVGKTTFFLLCNRILTPQHGQILHFGKPVCTKRDTMDLRRNVGIVFQDPENQIIATTVENEVSFGPMNLRLAQDEVATRVTESLTEMNLLDFRTRATHLLSGGEKKRVSIADILAMHPDCIFMDEPTASLDPANVVVLEEILQKLHENGIAVVISTHDIDFAYRFADRTLVFAEGELLADAPTQQVFCQDDLLQRARLRKPILFALTQILQAHALLPANVPAITDLTQLQTHLRP